MKTLTIAFATLATLGLALAVQADDAKKLPGEIFEKIPLHRLDGKSFQEAELKKDQKRRERNRGRRSAMRTWIKKTLVAIEEKNVEEAEKHFQLATKLIDKNVKWNQLHQNTAARKKANLARAMNALKASA